MSVGSSRGGTREIPGFFGDIPQSEIGDGSVEASPARHAIAVVAQHRRSSQPRFEYFGSGSLRERIPSRAEYARAEFPELSEPCSRREHRPESRREEGHS